MDLKQHIRTVADFPKNGIQFRDITSLLQEPRAFQHAVNQLAARYAGQTIDAIVGIDARGFVIASPLAYLLHSRLVLARKPGKLPGTTIEQAYQLEYGMAMLQMHTDAIENGWRVLLVDDLLATGGTLQAASELVLQCGGQIVECAVIVELPELGGRALLQPHAVYSLVSFTGD